VRGDRRDVGSADRHYPQPTSPGASGVARPLTGHGAGVRARSHTGPGVAMLPEPLRLLVSAYAAGDLSPRRRKAAVRLLRHSAEARTLLRDLLSNKRRLRNLPRRPLPAEFADQVVLKLSAVTPVIQPPVATARPSRARWSRLVPWAAAAAVLLAVGAGSYWFVTRLS